MTVTTVHTGEKSGHISNSLHDLWSMFKHYSDTFQMCAIGIMDFINLVRTDNEYFCCKH